MRVVISFTTIPSRYESLLKSVKSLQHQTYPIDQIYLAIPKYSKRLKQAYPPLPNELQELVKVVEMEQDYGPVSKLYGALDKEDDPETIIITCDDDTIMPDNFVEEYVKKSEINPEVCVCGTGALVGFGTKFISIYTSISPYYKYRFISGFVVPEVGRDIDIAYGVGGVLYKRKFFPKNIEKFFNLALVNEDVYLNDDIFISGYLSKMKIKRRLYYDLPIVIDKNGPNALSISSNLLERMDRALKYCQSNYGYYEKFEPINITEPIAFRIIILIIIILLILFTILFLIYYK